MSGTPDVGTADDSLSILSPLSKWRDSKIPEPILWRDNKTEGKGDTDVDAVLRVGGVAVLSSAGGIGKSILTLEVATAAVTAAPNRNAKACGLRVTAGPVVFISYEDDPEILAHRQAWMNQTGMDSLYLWEGPRPMWVASKCKEWEGLWEDVRKCGARMVVIDPVSAAMPTARSTDTGSPREFIRALSYEAKCSANWPGCGVLLVAHNTKTGRNALMEGRDPGADAVAGSAVWYDAPRGVLLLHEDPKDATIRVLECIKANHGRSWWGARLKERVGKDGAFRGLQLCASMTDSDLADWKRRRSGSPPIRQRPRRQRTTPDPTEV